MHGDLSNYNILNNYDPYTDTVLSDGDEDDNEYNDYMYKLDKKVPLIIWSKDSKYIKEVKTVTGMIDAYPILSNLFNLDKNKFSLGHDVLGLCLDDNVVPFVDGSYVTNKIYYNGQNSEFYTIVDEAISSDYVENNAKIANDMIDISNDIITYNLLKELKLDIKDIATKELSNLLENINIEEYSKKLNTDIYTLEEVIKCLQKPNRDPRDEMPQPVLKSDILNLEDLKIGMKLEGTVRNVVDFGAFIDIGLHNDGLIHISNISDKYIKHPSEVLSVGDIIDCYVIDINKDKEKVGLSLKEYQKN